MASISVFDATETTIDRLTSRLHAAGHQVTCIAEPLTAETVTLAAENSTVVSVFVTSDVNEKVMQALPNLSLIACRSTGTNHIDMDAAARHNISVANVPSYGEHTVAEYTFGMLLALTRKLVESTQAAQAGNATHTNLTGTDIANKTYGIVGTGRIGQKVARIARGFDMNVIAYDAFPREDLAQSIGFRYTSYEELLHLSDVISLHCPFTGDNYHMLGKAEFELMRQGAFVINTARGELINTSDLISALRSGKVAGAGLDVLEGEGLISSDEEILLLESARSNVRGLQHSLEIAILQKMSNVIVTYHNAFNTREALDRIDDTTVTAILRFLSEKL